MTDHDQRACPRCGQAAGEYHFCPSCLAPIDSLSGIPAHARVSDAAHDEPVATETATTAVQVETDERPGEDSAAVPTPQLALRTDAGVASQPPQAVARFEDVLTVLPNPAVKAAAAIASEISLRPGYSSQPRSTVARLEDVLTVAPSANSPLRSVPPPTPAPAPAPAQAPAPEPAETPAREPLPLAAEVAAHTLREAFWFEQAAAFQAEAARRVSIPPPAPVVEPVVSIAPPVVAAELETAPPVLAPAQISSHWLVALFLVALVALVAGLTGRRRSSGR